MFASLSRRTAFVLAGLSFVAASSLLAPRSATAQEAPADPAIGSDEGQAADAGLTGGIADGGPGDEESEPPLTWEERRARLWGKSRPASVPSHEQRLELLRGDRSAGVRTDSPASSPKIDQLMSEELETYRTRVAGGAFLTILGGLSLVSGLVGVFSLAIEGFVFDANSGGDKGAESDESASSDQPWAAPISLLCGGVVGLAVGLPLLISGRSGMKRIDQLSHLIELGRPAAGRSASAVELSLFAAAGSGSAQVRMVLEF